MNKLFRLIKYRADKRFKRNSLAAVQFLTMLPEKVVTEMLRWDDFDDACLHMLYVTREQIFHVMDEIVLAEGLHGWGGLPSLYIKFFRGLLDLNVEIRCVLSVNPDDFVAAIHWMYRYTMPWEYHYLASCRGLKFAIIDNIYGNIMGVYKSRFLDKEDLEYLCKTFDGLEINGIDYDVFPGNSDTAAITIDKP